MQEYNKEIFLATHKITTLHAVGWNFEAQVLKLWFNIVGTWSCEC